MLDINDTGDAIVAVVIALVAGALGGLVSELLLERGKARTTGVLTLPARSGRRLELGSAAALIIGLAAGLAATVLLVPVDDVVINQVKERQIDWWRLVGIAVVAGAAGQAFWAAVTKGLTATDFNARIDTLLATVKEQQANLPADDRGGAAGAHLEGVIAALESAREDGR
jgi:ABC-type Fe3+ transport system permease subunit